MHKEVYERDLKTWRMQGS